MNGDNPLFNNREFKVVVSVLVAFGFFLSVGMYYLVAETYLKVRTDYRKATCPVTCEGPTK